MPSEFRLKDGAYRIVLEREEAEAVIRPPCEYHDYVRYELSPALRSKAKTALGETFDQLYRIDIEQCELILHCSGDFLEWFLEQRGYRYSIRIRKSMREIPTEYIDDGILAIVHHTHTVFKMHSRESHLLLKIKLRDQLTWGGDASVEELLALIN